MHERERPFDKAVEHADHVGRQRLARAPKRRRHLLAHELHERLPATLVGELGEVIDRIVGGGQPGKRLEPGVLPPKGMAFGDGADGGTRVLGAASGELVADPCRRQILHQQHEVAALPVGGAEMHCWNANAGGGSDLAIEGDLALVEAEHHGELTRFRVLGRLLDDERCRQAFATVDITKA